MKKIICLMVLCVLVFAGYRWYSHKQTETFVAAMKKEYLGYRLEYFESDKSLFLLAPDGSKEGMLLDRKNIERVFLSKTPASENTFNKDLYRWEILYVMDLSPNSPNNWIRKSFVVPYFSLEPLEFLTVVKKELPEIDMNQSLQYAKELERNEFRLCSIWVRSGTKEFESSKETTICKH